MKCFKESVCVFIGLLVCFATATDPDCSNTDSKFACHGNRVLRDVMDHLTEDKPLRLIPGIEVLEVPSISTGRSSNEIEDDSVIGRVAKYMSTHEVKIKFPELMEKAEFADVINVAMKSLDDSKMVVGKFDCILSVLSLLTFDWILIFNLFTTKYAITELSKTFS